MLPVRTVLHPTDFSERSDCAFQLACSLARAHGARLIVLHVLKRSVLTSSGVMMAPPPAEQRQSLQEQLHRIKPPAPPSLSSTCSRRATRPRPLLCRSPGNAPAT